MRKKILCLVPSSLDHIRPDCIPAIESQTVKIDKLVIEPLPEGGELFDRVMSSANNALKRVDITNYDYILRVDGDCVLGKRYLERALNGDYDLYGPGCAMLLKVSTFQKVMGTRFKYADDAYLWGIYTLLKLKVSRGNNDFIHKSKNRTFKQRLVRGTYEGSIHHKMGWIPVQLGYDLSLDLIRGVDPLSSISQVYGYLIAKIRRLPQFDIAKQIQVYQIRRLFRRHKFEADI